MDQRTVNEIMAAKEAKDEKFEKSAFVKLYTDIIGAYMQKQEGDRSAADRLREMAKNNGESL